MFHFGKEIVRGWRGGGFNYLQAFKEFPGAAVVAALCKYLVLCLLERKKHTQTRHAF